MGSDGGRRDVSGLTLMELLIAAALVGLVLMGTLAVDVAMRRSRVTAEEDALLAMQTSALFLRIARDAELAVGDADSAGIDDTIGGALCIRKNEDASGNPTDPNTYADDTWVCYWREGDAVHRCLKDAATGPGACQATDPVAGYVTDFTYSFVANPPTDLYLDLSISNRPDRNADADPATNPEYTIHSRIIPIGHSF